MVLENRGQGERDPSKRIKFSHNSKTCQKLLSNISQSYRGNVQSWWSRLVLGKPREEEEHQVSLNYRAESNSKEGHGGETSVRDTYTTEQNPTQRNGTAVRPQ